MLRIAAIHCAVFVILFAPSTALAQDTGGPNRTLFGIITILEEALRALLPIAVGVALLFFFWGLALTILRAGSEAALAKGKSIMLWGVISLFVIVSIWGIVLFLANLFGVQVGGTCPPPSIGRSTVESCALP